MDTADLALADETEHPADRDAALVAEARDRDVDTGPAIGYRPGFNVQRASAAFRAAQVGLSGRISSGGGSFCLDRILLSLAVALPGGRPPASHRRCARPSRDSRVP
jgi:hypothetical protein